MPKVWPKRSQFLFSWFPSQDQVRVSKFKLEFQSNPSCFHSGKLADAIADDVWDVANIACEAERSKTIHFSPAYCEIQVIFKGILKTDEIEMSLQRIKASIW